MTDNRTPHVWLFDEIVRRFGKKTALELHAAYTDRQRQYNRDRWIPGLLPQRGKRVAWVPPDEREE